MKILIAVPSMEKVDALFAQSLANLKRDSDSTIQFMVGSLIYESRNVLAMSALEMNADFVLWLDSDIVFQPDLLERLLADINSKRDIVSALYFSRQYPYNPVIYSKTGFEEDKPVCVAYYDYPSDSVFKVEGCGFGAVLMKTQVLADINERFDNFFAPLIGFGEDLSFCIRAHNCGYDIWCDSRIKIGHLGSLTITEEYYQRLR